MIYKAFILILYLYIVYRMMILGNLIVNPVYYYDHLNSEEKSLIRKLRGRLGMLFGFHVIFLFCDLEGER